MAEDKSKTVGIKGRKYRSAGGPHRGAVAGVALCLVALLGLTLFSSVFRSVFASKWVVLEFCGSSARVGRAGTPGSSDDCADDRCTSAFSSSAVKSPYPHDPGTLLAALVFEKRGEAQVERRHIERGPPPRI